MTDMKTAKIGGTNRHHLACVDPGIEKILEFDENGNVISEIPTEGTAFDFWFLPDGTVLHSIILGREGGGFNLIDRQGKVLLSYRCPSQVFGVQPLENGNILVGELNEARMTEVDRTGRVVKIIPLKTVNTRHEQIRMVRRTPDGFYWASQPCDFALRKYDGDGNVVREIKTPGDTFAVIEDKDGNVYYSSMLAVHKVDKDNNEVWCADEKDLARAQIRWITGLELLENGNLMVCNWLGHGFEGQGVPLFELDMDKNIVWSLEAPEFTQIIACMQVLTEDKAKVCYAPMK